MKKRSRVTEVRLLGIPLVKLVMEDGTSEEAQAAGPITLLSKATTEASDLSPEMYTYVASAPFLRRVLKSLLQYPEEDAKYIAGVRHDRFYMMEWMEEFDCDKRSSVRVVGNDMSCLKSQRRIEDNGYEQVVWVHTHSGHGEGAVFTSSIDMGTQRRLERGGYPTIGAVFSRDGFVLFFSDKLPFKMDVRGKGVTEIHENLYKLSEV